MARASTDTAAWTWSAIIAGIVASLVVQVLLTMFGLGIGLISVSASEAGTGISWAAFAWWAATGVVAAFTGGWVAAAFSPTEDTYLRAAGAMTTWGVTILIVIATVGFAAGTTATVLSSLGGPAASSSARLDAMSRDSSRVTTTGQAAASKPSASVEDARRQFAAATLASFFALLLGGAAAFAAGVTATTMPGRAGKP